jgi:hypothetical protein
MSVSFPTKLKSNFDLILFVSDCKTSSAKQKISAATTKQNKWKSK